MGVKCHHLFSDPREEKLSKCGIAFWIWQEDLRLFSNCQLQKWNLQIYTFESVPPVPASTTHRAKAQELGHSGMADDQAAPSGSVPARTGLGVKTMLSVRISARV